MDCGPPPTYEDAVRGSDLNVQQLWQTVFVLQPGVGENTWTSYFSLWNNYFICFFRMRIPRMEKSEMPRKFVNILSKELIYTGVNFFQCDSSSQKKDFKCVWLILNYFDQKYCEYFCKSKEHNRWFMHCHKGFCFSWHFAWRNFVNMHGICSL